GLPKGPNAPVQNVDYWVVVTPGVFQTLKMQLIEGRFLQNSDGDGAQPVVVINQAMARHFYGNQSAIGRRVRLIDGEPWRTIVGVVADVKNAGLDRPAGTELYIPYAQCGRIPYAMQDFFAVLRTSREPALLTSSATEAVHGLDPALPVSHVATMDDLVSAAESRPRFLTMLLGLFSGLALILATVGIYGLMSYAVSQRTQEIGIRMALGARPADVQRMVLFHGLGITLSGIAVGVAAAFGLTRLMASLLFGVTATDPLTFAVIVGALAIAALGACYVPARRATSVDPMIALRYE
ncbi:MAG TPA: FtsX-like permease family protein, partial [Blastocatellia bacterium]|nr:FtsX-like permease family protein [Blastocatellia bacterium]